ncbi:MAG: nucleotidyltransferase family protein [Bacteroidales bacterium]|nr:nucleotidyltransferase family protein [Bacteroidales bacterium]
MTSAQSLELLLRILGGGLPPSGLDEESWMDLIRTAGRQTVTGLLYNAAERFPESIRIPERAMYVLLEKVRRTAGRNMELAGAEKEVLELLHTEKVRALVMKGSSCAARYPSPELRTGGDIDLYIPEKDFQRALDVIGGAGIEYSRKPDSSVAFTLRGCEVELHRSYFDLHVRKEKLPPVGTPEAELLMLSAHILKHACSAGVGLRQIFDFAFAYKAYHGDYRQLGELFGRCGLSRWNALLLSFVKDYIDPAAEVPSKVDSAELFRIVERGGNFGHFRDGRLESVRHGTAFRRKLNTLRRILSNLRFSLRYASREILPYTAGLLRGNLR